MKNTHTIEGEIINIEWLPSSRNGNPRFKLIIGEPGNSVTAVTSPDSMLAYSIGNYRNGDRVRATIGEHYGRDTIADIEKLD